MSLRGTTRISGLRYSSMRLSTFDASSAFDWRGGLPVVSNRINERNSDRYPSMASSTAPTSAPSTSGFIMLPVFRVILWSNSRFSESSAETDITTTRSMRFRHRGRSKNDSMVLASVTFNSFRFSCSVSQTSASKIPLSIIRTSVIVSTWASNSASMDAAHHVLKNKWPFIGIGQTAARSAST